MTDWRVWTLAFAGLCFLYPFIVTWFRRRRHRRDFWEQLDRIGARPTPSPPRSRHLRNQDTHVIRLPKDREAWLSRNYKKIYKPPPEENEE